MTSKKLSSTRWLHALWLRCRTLWPLKLIGNTVATAGFFPLYFWIMQNAGQPWTLPLTAFDRLIAFWPALLPVYLRCGSTSRCRCSLPRTGGSCGALR